MSVRSFPPLRRAAVILSSLAVVVLTGCSTATPPLAASQSMRPAPVAAGVPKASVPTPIATAGSAAASSAAPGGKPSSTRPPVVAPPTPPAASSGTGGVAPGGGAGPGFPISCLEGTSSQPSLCARTDQWPEVGAALAVVPASARGSIVKSTVADPTSVCSGSQPAGCAPPDRPLALVVFQRAGDSPAMRVLVFRMPSGALAATLLA